MFILLFFSFSKSQILDGFINTNNESDKKCPIVVTSVKSPQAVNAEDVIQESPKHYRENLFLLRPHGASEPNLEPDKETVVDGNNTKPFQDAKTALTNSEQKIKEIAETIKTQYPELHLTWEKKAYEFYNKIQPNGLKDLILLQEKINITSKKLVALKIRRDLEAVEKLLRAEVAVISTYCNGFEEVITFFLETVEKNCPQTESEKDTFFKELYEKVNAVDPEKLLRLKIQKKLGKVIAKIGKYLEKKTTIEINSEEFLKIIEPCVPRETILKITKAEEELSILEERLKNYQDNFKDGINQFIVLKYVLNKKTDKNSDLYNEARKSIANYYIAVFSGMLVSDFKNDIIMEELDQNKILTDAKIELKNNKIARDFYEKMIILMKKSLGFEKNNTIFTIIKKIQKILPEKNTSMGIYEPWNPEGKNRENILFSIKELGSLQAHITNLIKICKDEVKLPIEQVTFVRNYENMYEYQLNIKGVKDPLIFVVFVHMEYNESPALSPNFKGMKECWMFAAEDALTLQIFAHELAHVIDFYKNNKTISEAIHSMTSELPAIFAEQVKAPLMERYSPQEILLPMMFFLKKQDVAFEALQLNHETREFISYVLDSLGDKKELIIKNLRRPTGYFINEMIVRYLEKKGIKTSVGEIIDLCKDSSLEKVLDHYKISIKDLASLAWDVYFAKAVSN